MTDVLTNIRADLYPTRGKTEVVTPRQDPVVWSPPGAPGPVSRTDLQNFERDGFLTVDQLLAPDEVTLFQAELNRLITDPGVRADKRSIIEP